MSSTFNLGDYVDVKERLKLFYDRYPDGSIQFEFKGILESNPDMIWGIAYAYRTAEDQKPGIGTASELAIGKTTYTRGSELMNLETSAWGRAIAALGIGLGKSVATKQEVQSAAERQMDPWGEKPLPAVPERPVKGPASPMTDKQYKYIIACFNGATDAMKAYVDEWKQKHDIDLEAKLTMSDASKLIDQLAIDGYQPIKRSRTIDTESKD